MSLARVALRIAAVEALCPAQAITSAGPYPTPAGPQVFSSRLDELEEAEFEALEGQPIVAVYTEEDQTNPYGAPDTRYPVGEQFVDLVIELAIAVKGSLSLVGPDGAVTLGSTGALVTDEQHETAIDLLEALVRRLFERDHAMPSAALFRMVAMEVRHVHSVPQRIASDTLRIRRRTVKFQCKVKKDVWPQGAAAGALPMPLNAVAAALTPGSANALLCAAIAAAIPAGAALNTTPLQIGFFAGLGRMPTPAAFDAQGLVTTAPPPAT